LIIEEALDEVSVSIEEGAEGRHVLAVWQGLDIGSCAPFIAALPQLVAVIGAVGQKVCLSPNPRLAPPIEAVNADGVRVHDLGSRGKIEQPQLYPVPAAEAILRQGSREMNGGASRGVKRLAQRLSGGAKRDAVYFASIAGLRAQPHMAVADVDNIGEAMRGQGKNRFWIAGAIGASACEAGQQCWIGTGRDQRRVDQQEFATPRGSNWSGEVCFEVFPEIAEPFPRESDARRHRMAAALGENPGIDRRAHHTA
jgi:hypothetical protein